MEGGDLGREVWRAVKREKGRRGGRQCICFEGSLIEKVTLGSASSGCGVIVNPQHGSVKTALAFHAVAKCQNRC